MIKAKQNKIKTRVSQKDSQYHTQASCELLNGRTPPAFEFPQTYLEVSTASVLLIELAPDSRSSSTQIAPNGKRAAP